LLLSEADAEKIELVLSNTARLEVVLVILSFLYWFFFFFFFFLDDRSEDQHCVAG
jgi:hypothetical protein